MIILIYFIFIVVLLTAWQFMTVRTIWRRKSVLIADKCGTWLSTQLRNAFRKCVKKLFKFQICFIQSDPLNYSKEGRRSRIIVYFMLLQSKYCFRVCIPCSLYYFNPNFNVTVVYLFNSFLGLTVTNLVLQIIRF